MRIERLVLHAFGKFRGLDITLRPGLNVVYGPNEAGKSTLQGFIFGMLYGFWKPGARRRIPSEDLQRFRPWWGAEYRGTLEYRLDSGQAIRVDRDFATGRVAVSDAATGCPLRFPQDERREPLFARAHLGLSDAEFLRTAWVGQGQLPVSGDPDLAQRLHNLHQTGQEGLSLRRVLDRLEAQRREVMERLRALRQQLESRQAELDRLRRERERCLDDEVRLRQLEAQVAAARGRVAGLEVRHAAARLAEVEARLDQAAALAAEARRLAAELAALDRYRDFPGHREPEVAALAARTALLARQVAEAEERLRAAESERDRAAAALAGLHDCRTLPAGAADRVRDVRARWQAVQEELARRRAPLGARKLEVENRERKLADLQAAGDPAELEARLQALQAAAQAAGAPTPEEWLARVRGQVAAARRRGALAVPLGVAALVAAAAALAVAWAGGPAAVAWGLGVLALALGAWAAMALAARRQAAALRGSLDRAEEACRSWRQILAAVGAADALACQGRLAEWRRFAEETARLRAELEAQRAEVERLQQQSAALVAAFEELAAPVAHLISGSGLEARASALLALLDRWQQAVAALATAERAVAAAAADLAQRRQDLAAAQGELAAILAEAGVADVAAFREGCDQWRRWQEVAARHQEVLRRQDEALGGQDPATWEAEAGRWRALLAAVVAREGAAAAGEAALPAAGVPVPGEPAAALAAALAAARDELASLEAEVARLQGSLARAYGQVEGLDRLAAEVERLQAAVAELEDEKAALELARQHLEAAADDLHREFAPRLGAALAQVLPRLTGGRYVGAAVGEDMSLHLDMPGGQRVAAANLSAGTQDQAYLALRVALLELLVPPGGERPPILLDDPFVQCDDARLEGCLDLLVRLAEMYQVILFTCHRRELAGVQARAPGAHVVLLE